MTRKWISKEATARDGEGIYAPLLRETKDERKSRIHERKKRRRKDAMCAAAHMLLPLIGWGVMIYCCITLVEMVTDFATRVSNYLNSQGF